MSYTTTNQFNVVEFSRERFKPEKSQRRPVSKMKWSQSRWSRSLAGDLFSCLPPSSPSTGIGGGINNNINSNNGHIMAGVYDYNNIMANCIGSNNNILYSNGIGESNFYNGYGNYGIIGLPTISNPGMLESESRVSSMTIADVSPRLAVKKVLLLYEHAQYREAANFIHRLSIGTFRIILRELPLDIFVEAMPHSLPIMEALYSKVFTSDGPSVSLKILRPEAVVMHMVKFFSREEMIREIRNRRETIGPFTAGCKKILQVIVLTEPKMIKTLQLRRRALDKAVEGMGQHGLVGTTDESLLPLHDALKLEFHRVVDTYKNALQKLEDLSLAAKNNPKSVVHGPAPIHASHQRQLSLKAEEIQDRLIKNKSLLNVVEPTLDNNCLDILLGILQRRIECDKESLFQFIQLRKEAGDITYESIVAPLLMRYSRGCKQVLEMMREVANEAGGLDEIYDDDSSDLSGYHSDSDSAIMTSGNSPYISPRARYNFISRSVRSKAILRPSIMFNSATSSSSSGVSCLDSSRSGSGFSSCCIIDSPSTNSTPPPPPSTLATANPQTKVLAATQGNNISQNGLYCECSSKSLDYCNKQQLLHHKNKLSKTSSTNTIKTTTTPPSIPSTTPIRPRHVKLKNQLHKNNSLASTSSGGSDSSGSLQEAEFTLSHCNNNNDKLHNNGQEQCAAGCIDCVTLVSVPDNHVITQGVNHHCSSNPATTTTSNNNNNNNNNNNKMVGGQSSDVQSNNNININDSSEKEKLIHDLQSEINQLRRGLANANTTINHLQEREKKFLILAARTNVIENGHSNNHHTNNNSNNNSGSHDGSMSNGNNNSKLSLKPHTTTPLLNSIRDKESKRSQWVHEYGALYAQARVETMDALDALPYLANADELKSKLLYSVVVLSFRAVQSNVSEIKKQVQCLLQMNQLTSSSSSAQQNHANNNINNGKALARLPPSAHHLNFAKSKNGLCNNNKSSINNLLLVPLQSRVLESINDYLQYSGHLFDLSKCVEQVANQLWTTLYDYPRLKKCETLKKYITSCVNLAWGLTNQTPSCVLEYETKVFMRDMHVRFHSSNQNSENIKVYLWPALLEGPQGVCIHKGVVIT